MRIFLASLALLLGLTTANAQISGQNDPQFKAALAQWLEGDDLAALPALSKLAMVNNRAAQVFLGRIDYKRHTHEHLTGQSPKGYSITRMSKLYGFQGESWLEAASKDVPLAMVFLKSEADRENPEIIRALLDMGEVPAALKLLFSLVARRQSVNQDELLTHPNLPDHAVFLRAVIEKANSRGENTASDAYRYGSYINNLNQTLSAEQADNISFMWEGFIRVQTGYDQPIRRIPDTFPNGLIDSPYYAPLKAFCSQRCENDIPKCMRAITIHQHWATPMWIKLSSPVESLLPTSEYQNSPRVMGDLIRLVKHARVGSKELQEYDQCAYQAVFAE